MRNAETVLGIIHERGTQGLPLDDVYRQLYNPQLYRYAYGRIYRNTGAMTPGSTAETADGMSLANIESLIDALRHERYRWKPVRRVDIEKKNATKKRPLGVPTWSDKLLQEVLRLILEAYDEPQFSRYSHGFRPKRGCQTALREISYRWVGTKWVIEGDIAACFESLNHTVLVSIRREKIHDNRFLRLIEHLLRAGYLAAWTYHTTLSGSPQGAVLSPILSNISLSKLDAFVAQTLMPTYTRGTRRKINPPWAHLRDAAKTLRLAGCRHEARRMRRQMQAVPSLDPHDPHSRRLRYMRYADDWLLGFSGPRSEAEAIQQAIGTFLRAHLKLELSDHKTLITHARTHAARFLGYDIVVLQNDRKLDQRGHRSLNGQIGLRVPKAVLQTKCAPSLRHGKPIHRAALLHDTPFSIVAQYQQEYRGLVEYYRLAYNLHVLNHLKWVMERSLVQTLAQKLRVSVCEVYRHYHTTFQTDHGPRVGLQVTVERKDGHKPLRARWGGLSLSRNMQAPLDDAPLRVCGPRTELVQRLLANTCELCGSEENVEVHHIRALKDLRRQGQIERPFWRQVMAARQRKTLVTCRPCHTAIHWGEPIQKSAATEKTLESRVLRKASARFGGGRMEKYPQRQLASRLPYFVITAPTREVLETYARPRVEKFLEERGLALSEAKTRIVHITEGVNFLGFHIRKFGKQGKLLTVPQKEKVLKHVRAIRSYLDAHKQTPAGRVIKELNPVIRGWANYYRHCAAKHVFQKVRHAQWQMLWRWAKRRHPNKGSKWVKARYFRNDSYWTFYEGKAELVKPDVTPITRFTKVIGKYSPYDPTLRQYWVERKKQQVRRETYAKQRLILHQRQGYRCALCSIPLTAGETIETDHIIPTSQGGADDLNNKRLVHPWCHRQRHQKDGRQWPRA